MDPTISQIASLHTANERRRFLLSAIAGIATWTPDQANGIAARSSRDLLIVGTHFPRIYEMGSDGHFTGMGADLVRIVADQLGYTVRYKIYPWARAQRLTESGQADILVGPYKTQERLQTMSFSSLPFFADELVFYTRSDNTIAWDGNYRSLAGKRVVILNGWAYGDEFDKGHWGIAVETSNSVESGFKLLMHKRADLFATSRRDGEPVIASLGLKGRVVALSPLIDTQKAYLAFPKQPAPYDAIHFQFDVVLRKMISGGGLQKLGRRYGLLVPESPGRTP